MTDIKNPPQVSVHGWLALDKPLGLTSTQALGKARRCVGGKKAGHGGTLDPLATGILPLAFGEATKLIPYIMDGDKEYEFTLRWGEARDTEDAEGKVTATSDIRPSDNAIRSLLQRFMGVVRQTPPAYSAIKLDGERAYDIARAGGVVEMVARDVEIFELEYRGATDADHAAFFVACGKGMYVRSLARDMALALGTCGHVSSLRRIRVGPFGIEDAITLEKLTGLCEMGQGANAVLPIKSALDGIPVMNLLPNEAHNLRLGKTVLMRPQHGDLIEQPLIFAEHQGVPVAMIEPRAGEFRVVRGFSF